MSYRKNVTDKEQQGIENYFYHNNIPVFMDGKTKEIKAYEKNREGNIFRGGILRNWRDY